MSKTELAELLHQGFRYALALTHDKHRAEDILQDAWIGVLQAHGPHVKGYLFSAIRSRFLNQSKRDLLVPLVSLDSSDTELTEPESVDIDINIELNELALHLEALRPVEREAIFLSAVEGYTAEEISQHTGNPRGTVLSLISRARIKLRRRICEQQEVKHGEN